MRYNHLSEIGTTFGPIERLFCGLEGRSQITAEILDDALAPEHGRETLGIASPIAQLACATPSLDNFGCGPAAERHQASPQRYL